MALEDFVIALIVAGYVLQIAAFFLVWLVRAGSPELKARWRPISNAPEYVVYLMVAIAAIGAVAWPIAAANAGVPPATQVVRLQEALFHWSDIDTTILILFCVSAPYVPLALPFGLLWMFAGGLPDGHPVRRFSDRTASIVSVFWSTERPKRPKRRQSKRRQRRPRRR